MTMLEKTVRRETKATRFERSKSRAIIVTLEPPSLLGFRLKGTRRTFYLDADSCYSIAVKAELKSKERDKQSSRKKRS